MSPIFQKAVDICKELLRRNNISNDKLDTLILVGGPTYSPILRDMLHEQITPNVDTSIDPMTAVAQGAALYASGINVVSDKEIESGTVALEVSYESDSVESEEYVTIKLLPNSCKGSINTVYVHVTLIYQLIGVIRNCNQEFSTIPWKNAIRARQLLNQGEEMINNNPTADDLHS
ncbi:MAG: Hsp70 family protein [Rikenellaceae bacterium]